MSEPFIKRVWTKPPILFPLVALFHLLMLFYSIWNYREFPFPSESWISTAWILSYTICWIFICDLRHWALLTYIGLTALSVILQFTLKFRSEVDLYTPTFYIIYILFCVFLVFYYKKFRQ